MASRPMVGPFQMPRQVPAVQPPHLAPSAPQKQDRIMVSDLRRERMTEATAREALSDYIIYRFEKVGETDYDGQSARSTWEKVYRIRVKDFSYKDAARRVRELNRESGPVARKKAGLLGSQQRQLEKTLHDLLKEETDSMYEITLAQIEHQLRDKYPDSDARPHKTHLYKAAKPAADRDGRRPRPSSSTSSRKMIKERVSITAYYKRSPKPGLDALMLYDRREQQNRMAMAPKATMLQANSMATGMMAGMATGMPALLRHPSAAPPAMGRNPTPTRPSLHSQSSADSMHSHVFSDTCTNYSAESPTSSYSSSPGSCSSPASEHDRRRHGRSEPHRSHSHNSHNSLSHKHLASADRHRPRQPHSPCFFADDVPVMSPLVDMQRLRDGAYAAGQVDERLRALEEREFTLSTREARDAMRCPPSLPPRTSRERPAVRHVNSDDVMYHIERLRLHDECEQGRWGRDDCREYRGRDGDGRTRYERPIPSRRATSPPYPDGPWGPGWGPEARPDERPPVRPPMRPPMKRRGAFEGLALY